MPNLRGYRSQTWLLAGALTIAAGCSAGTPPGMTAQQAAPGQQQGVPGQQQAAAGPQQGEQDPLGLSDQQKQKLAQTLQSLRPSQAQQQVMQQIQQQLLADNVDVPKLTAALEASRQALVQNVDKVVGMFQGLRQILDDSQRNKLVGLMQQVPSQAGAMEFPPELNLSKDQQAALASLRPDEKRLNQTLINYLQSGDDNALRQAVTADVAAMPQPAAIAQALASLSHDQRQKMFTPPDQGQGQ